MSGNNDTARKFEWLRKQVSDYALAFDTMANIAHLDNEDDVIGYILHFVQMLFLPEVLNYLAIHNGRPHRVYSLSAGTVDEKAVIARLGNIDSKYQLSPSQAGFSVKFQHLGNDFGILEVEKLAFPENIEQYINLTLSITDVCGLAIANARRTQKLIEKENTLRGEKEKLKAALDKVRALSGLLPICSHCKNIRDDKGYWKQIEAFLEEHSEVEFTHSICKECATKLYPDLDIYPE